MAASLQRNGQLIPIKVRQSVCEPGKYEVVCGHRRFFAAKSLGWKSIRAELCSLTEHNMIDESLIENLEREDLSDFDKALIFERINTDFHMTYEQIGEMVGLSKQHVSNCIALLRLFSKETLAARPEIREALFHITEHHGRVLSKVADPSTRESLLLLVVKQNLTVAALGNMACRLKSWFSPTIQLSQDIATKYQANDGSVEKDIQQIKEIVLERFRLLECGDLSSMLMDVYDEKFSFYSAYPPLDRVEGAEIRPRLRSIFEEISTNLTITVKDLNVDLYDDTAVVTLTRCHRHKCSQKKNEQFRGSLILRKRHGKWRFIHEHWSSIPRLDTLISNKIGHQASSKQHAFMERLYAPPAETPQEEQENYDNLLLTNRAIQ